MAQKIKKIDHDLRKGRVDSNETGLHIDAKKIEIDLNKTKTFMEKMQEKIEDLGKSLEKIGEEMRAEPKKHAK